MKKLVLAFLCMVSWLTLFAQPEATPMTAGKTAEGIVYFLPKTVFNFHLLIEQKTYQPGPFARYASRYLRKKNVCQEPETDYRILKIEVTQSGIRDTSKCYALKLKGGKCETAEVRLSDDGVLLAINDEPMRGLAHSPFLPSTRIPLADPTRFMTEEVRAAGSTAKMAELTAAQMADLRESREQLITGEAEEMPQDHEQLQRMIHEIDSEYAALESLFLGVEQCDTTEQEVSFCPEGEVAREVFFRLSKKRGVVDKDDLSGVPYYIKVEDVYQVNVAKYPPADQKKHEGLYVNVPGRLRLSLYGEDTLLQTFELPAAQFGFVELRDAQLFKRYVTHLQLHPATGAVVSTRVEEGKK